MTDELKFFDPETGAELHRVPEGAMIPAGTPCGFIDCGKHWWRPRGVDRDLHVEDGFPRFTREPIAPPAPPLPTEPGTTIRAVSEGGGECSVMTRSLSGHWHGVDQNGVFCYWNDEDIREWGPVAIVPTETWNRLRVLDPEDKRDRVDAAGDMWRYEQDEQTSSWAGYLAYAYEYCGPLRFADEVSGDE